MRARALVLVAGVSLALVGIGVRPHLGGRDATNGGTRPGPALQADSLRGRILVINLWASWCAPCRAELPALEALARRYASREVMFLSLNVDSDSGAARRFLQRERLALPVVFVGPRGTERFAAQGIPATLVIDGTGREVGRWLGFSGDAQMVAIAARIAQARASTRAVAASQYTSPVRRFHPMSQEQSP